MWIAQERVNWSAIKERKEEKQKNIKKWQKYKAQSTKHKAKKVSNLLSR